MTNRLAPKSFLATVATAAIATTLSVGCGSDSGRDARYSGTLVTPAKPAPPLHLDDFRGRPFQLKHLRGDAVLVTFIYTHCPDVCPLIVSHLKTAQAMLGSGADKLTVVAVSADPRGDTPQSVRRFLRDHGMRERMEYLIGTRRELGRVWRDWGIAAVPANAGRDLIEHSAPVYGIDAEGRIKTVYAANFRPVQLVHDVPLLEGP